MDPRKRYGWYQTNRMTIEQYFHMLIVFLLALAIMNGDSFIFVFNIP